MRKKILLIVTFAVCQSLLQSQENSLLWEISGKNLENKSYIYGTMHVSRKVAFRLDDVFFNALNESECIALESDPTKWQENTYEELSLIENNINRSYGENLYSRIFNINPINENLIRGVIRVDNSMINGYLYRKNPFGDNFEEETYLDMFIYQAGKKKQKPIIGLEDINESRFLTAKANYNTRKKQIDKWWAKRLKDESAITSMEDIYRDRNVELLDSVGAAINTEFYREHMLYKRNKNMVTVLDSLMPKKSVFAGVGAAHLGGKKGMLQMLRDLGYTIRPLTGLQSQFAEDQKDKYETLFIKPKLVKSSTPDNYISLKSFDSLREFTINNMKFYIAPDMTNGSFLTINRLSTFSAFPNKTETVSLDRIKYLLYEDIPGDIIKQEAIKKPYEGIKIINKTKKGDYQRYHIYKTPLEIIVEKFGGKKDFVLKYGDEIFDSICFKTKSNELSIFNDPLLKYSFKFPEYYITDNIYNPGKKLIQGQTTNGYYFFQESPLHDTNYIEEDAFEAEFLHTNFYDNLDIEDFKGELLDFNGYKSYESVASLKDGKQLFLKTIVKDASYYIMGFIGTDENAARSYFKSLKIKIAQYENFKVIRDTSLLFTVNTVTKPPQSFRYSRKKIKPYEEFDKNSVYTSKSNEKIFVSKIKFHDFTMERDIDSFWNTIDNFKEPIYRPFKLKALKRSNKVKYIKDGKYVYSYTDEDTLSKKRIRVKYILKKGALFRLTTLTDHEEPSQFVKEFFDTFTPLDSILGKNIFEDKTNLFFDRLRANDSIVLKGQYYLEYKQKDSDSLWSVINDFSFPEDRKAIKLNLINNYIDINNIPDIENNLKTLYTKSYEKPKVQISILKSLLEKKQEDANKLLLSLIENDVPLPNNRSNLGFYENNIKVLKSRKSLFPNIIDLTSIEVYKKPIYRLLATMVDSNYVSPKAYKNYKNLISNNAKIELKKSLISTGYSKIRNKDVLNYYTKILFPLRKDKNVSQFFSRLLVSDNKEALTTFYILLLKNGEKISKTLQDATIENPEAQALLINKLQENELLSNKIISKIKIEDYARSSILGIQKNYKPADSLSLYETKDITTDTGKVLKLFIYKKRPSNFENRKTSYLYFIALELSKDALGFIPKPYYISRSNGNYINNINTEEEVIEKILPLIVHKTRKRINGSYY